MSLFAKQSATGTPSPPPTRKGRSIGATVRRNHRLMLAGAALIALVGVFAFWGEEEDTEEQNLAAVSRGDIENVVTAAGNLQPLNFVDVGAQVSGQLDTLYVDAGDQVMEGDLLAEIDATVQMTQVASIRAQLQALQAELQDRQAQLRLARIQAERQARLMADNATSQEEIDSADATLTSAEAQLRSTEARIDEVRSELQGEEALLGYSKIYAPFSGTISSITAKEGQTLNANQSAPTILQIADLSKMTVSTQVSEADVPKLNIGMDAYFTTLGGGARRWSGNLRQILPTPTVVNNVVLYTALFEVENSGQELMTQMTAQVFFVVDAAYDVLRVPVGAVRYQPRERPSRDNDGEAEGSNGARNETAEATAPRSPQPQHRSDEGRPATVMVVNADGETEARDIVTGASDRIYVEVKSGLEDGDQVVVMATARAPAQNNNNNNRFGGGFGPPMGGLP